MKRLGTQLLHAGQIETQPVALAALAVILVEDKTAGNAVERT
jgi:hypothetical protein